MKLPISTIRVTLALLSGLWLAACASTNDLRDAENAVRSGLYEEGLASLGALERAGQDPKQVQAAMLRARSIAIERLEHEARIALDAERFDAAELAYKRMSVVVPGADTARIGLDMVRMQRRVADKLTKAGILLKQGDVDAGVAIVDDILIESPNNPRALALQSQLAERQQKTSGLPPELAPEFKKSISLEFRDVGLKSVIDAIWHVSGINFILDHDIRSDVRVSIFVRDVTVEEAIDALLMTQQLARKSIGSKMLFIYPKTPQKIAEYRDLTVRNFYLAHADAKQMQLLLKTILKIKDVFIDEKRNLLVVRDSPEAVNMADKLIRAHDQQEPEVMLAVDVLEISRSKLSEIGLNLPDTVGFSVANPITVDALRHLNSQGFNVGFNGAFSNGTAGTVAEVRLKKTDGDNNMLANPRIRVRNREKAKIHIGDRLPVVTTTSSTTSSFVGQTVNYLDVGLKLEVEPQVMLDDDVVIKLNLEVSSATQSRVNTSFYDVGTRTTATVLTIHDGETQVLAGLIRDDERQSSNRLPGIGDVPLLGRLFANERNEHDKTEIILAITPRVLRNLKRPEATLASYNSGTEAGMVGSAPAAPDTTTASSSMQTTTGRMPTAGGGRPAGRTGRGGTNALTSSGGEPPQAGTQPRTEPVSPADSAPMTNFEAPPGIGSTNGQR